MTFEEWWEKRSRECRKTYVLMGSFALTKVARDAWDAALSNHQNAADPPVGGAAEVSDVGGESVQSRAGR